MTSPFAHPPLLLLALVATVSPAAAQLGGDAKPGRGTGTASPAPSAPPPATGGAPAHGWLFEGPVGSRTASLSYGACRRNCGNHDDALLRVFCPRGGEPNLILPMPDPLRAGVFEDRTVNVTFRVDTLFWTMRMEVGGGPQGPVATGRVGPSGALFQSLPHGRALRIEAPSGIETMSLQGVAGPLGRWQQACGAGGTAPVASPGGLGHLARFAGTYEDDRVLRDPRVAAALTGLAGQVVVQRARRNMGVRGPILAEGPLLVLSGGLPHMVDQEAAMVTIDLQTGAVELGLHSDDRLTLYGGTGRDSLSAPLLRWAADRGVPGGFVHRPATRR